MNLLIINYCLESIEVYRVFAGKKSSRPAKVVETGTEGEDGVDYEWIPKSALRNTPASGKTSPRQRKNKAGSDSD